MFHVLLTTTNRTISVAEATGHTFGSIVFSQVFEKRIWNYIPSIICLSPSLVEPAAQTDRKTRVLYAARTTKKKTHFSTYCGEDKTRDIRVSNMYFFSHPRSKHVILLFCNFDSYDIKRGRKQEIYSKR